jgi:hypothetical protein
VGESEIVRIEDSEQKYAIRGEVQYALSKEEKAYFQKIDPLDGGTAPTKEEESVETDEDIINSFEYKEKQELFHLEKLASGGMKAEGPAAIDLTPTREIQLKLQEAAKVRAAIPVPKEVVEVPLEALPMIQPPKLVPEVWPEYLPKPKTTSWWDDGKYVVIPAIIAGLGASGLFILKHFKKGE